MNPQFPAPLLALIELSEKADGGTWDFQEEMTEFYNDTDGNSCGGHPTGNYYIWDRDNPDEDAWIHPHNQENSMFICALVNWFRAEGKDLAELVHYWKSQHTTLLTAYNELLADKGWKEVEYQFEVWQGDEYQAGGSAMTSHECGAEAAHYAAMYGQDGPVEVRFYERRALTTTPESN